MEQLQYKIDDRTIVELLGKQNFTTEGSAVLELVKNAYDANASHLIIDFGADTLTITDDGCGMNAEDIREHWMWVGRSDKGYKTVYGVENTRVLAGSKGIGRFALSRLGGRVTLLSKKAGFEGVSWQTDWVTSTIDDDYSGSCGTKIIISDLTQKWTQKRIHDLEDYLSRAYHDTVMQIELRALEMEPIVISNCFPSMKMGIHYVQNIQLRYDAKEKKLLTEIVSDEFSDEANEFCLIDLKRHSEQNQMAKELATKYSAYYTVEELAEHLERLGSFAADLYFANQPTGEDVEKFCYKHEKLTSALGVGIIIYRNAFSISSFEGKKDWLELGKRSRKSPASPSHKTGTWRVRDNQLAGMVLIDKEANAGLRELSNRQGMEENLYYQLFSDILLTGISNFERYRQRIIRDIDRKNHLVQQALIETPIINKISSPKTKTINLSSDELRQLKKEIKMIKEDSTFSKKEREVSEERYKYDVRILNVLSTIGLKASAIAHEMRNDRNAIAYDIDYIIKALMDYGFWDALNDSDHTQAKYKNVPALLEEEKEITQKLVVFMNTMLEETKKEKFVNQTSSIEETIKKRCRLWHKDYSWVHIIFEADECLTLRIHEDLLMVILDNLILNSIQQNKERQSTNLTIRISAQQENGIGRFVYHDDGKGLHEKYHDDPRRILEVHETTRPDGHGLGMWIVYNTILSTGGDIQMISPYPGFTMEFTLGGGEK